jgi:hypothetical protein
MPRDGDVKMRSMVRTATLMAVAMTISSAAVAPLAYGQENCATYGYVALKQARENERRKCGFTGPRWSVDLKQHVAWCATVGPPDWKTELRERAKALEKCGG